MPAAFRVPAIPGLRSVVQTGLAMVCVLMVAVGLFLTSQPAGSGVVLDRPGIPAKLASGDMTATAFFEMAGDQIELTMLFSELEDETGVFRSRVRLSEGQRHTIVLAAEARTAGARFVFRRVGQTVEMSLDQPTTLGAMLGFTS